MRSGHKRIVVVADDLTGAADSSAPFAAAGIPTEIYLNPRHLPLAGAVALVTNTRHSSATETEARNFELVRGVLGDRSNAIVYQKIDSTLRGYPAHALAGAMRALAVERALVAPACPDQGRTTIDGQQLVYGQPLEESAFQHEARTGDVRHVFRQRFPAVTSIPIGGDSIDLRAMQVNIADAETDADLDKLTAAALASDLPVYCGSAGLAKALAKALSVGRASKPLIAEPPASGAILAVIGSRHPTSRQQLEFAAARGIALVEATAPELNDAPQAFVEKLCAELSKAGAAILTTPTRELPMEPKIIPARLAAIVRAVLKRCPVRALILSGGDTAHAVANAIGASRIRLLGEIEPGIAFGRWQDGLAKHQALVTKAGGFGTDRSLHQIIEYFPLNPSAEQ